MGVIQSIKNFFRKGAVQIGAKKEYQSILDHPKIQMNPKEFARIQDSFLRYKQEPESENFMNSNRHFKQRKKSKINMIKKVSSEYVKVMFNEQAEIIIGKKKEGSSELEDTSNNDWLEAIFKHNDFKKNLGRYLEPAMALGGLAVRPYYNSSSSQIEFSWALADGFFPLQSNTNKISECAIAFKTTITEKGENIYYTLLEFHEWVDGEYWISNELYMSEREAMLGVQVSLATLEQYAEMESSVKGEGIERPIIVYFRPAGFNNITPNSPLGIGVCDNAKDTLDQINRAANEFDLEIKRGRRRIAASDMLLNSRTNGDNILQYFDDDEDVFQMVPNTDMDDYTIKDLTSDIRTSQYIETINHHLRTLEMETGLSNGTFTFDGQQVRAGNKTATEVVSENSQTYQSRNLQISELETFIKDVILAVFELGAATLGDNGKPLFEGEPPTHDEIGINFDDGVFINKEAESAYYRELYNDGLIPGWLAIQKIMSVPEDKAKSLYREAQVGVVESTTKNMNNSGYEDFEE